jgi:hypothetical protein
VISSALLIAQADLAVVRLIRAAIAPPKNTGPVLESDPRYSRQFTDRFECTQGYDAATHLNKQYVFRGPVLAPPIPLPDPSIPPPLDPGAVDFRDLNYRRKEASLPAPWAHLPAVAESHTKIQHHYHQVAVASSRNVKGISLDLFC